MSLTKKDPSFCVAANDPHLVSLGGGRLSTAVTIHNIPIGDTSIGSSTNCSISLNGSGIKPLHCIIYRSEENEVTLVPEHDARILVDGHKITDEINLTQGAMITVGKSYYLRFNNPAEAHQIRTAMGSSERVTMSQLNFCSSDPLDNSLKSITSLDDILSGGRAGMPIEANEVAQVDLNTRTNSNFHDTHFKPININELQCPKVFTSDLVTVNLPAKDVLGQKFARFARNISENNRANEKNLNNALQNQARSNSLSTNINNNNNNNAKINERTQDTTTPNNIPPAATMTAMPQQSNSNTEYCLSKVKNTNETQRNANKSAYDRYPKLGGLQIFPMNSINNEMNTSAANAFRQERNGNTSLSQQQQQVDKDDLDDMLKLCTEYSDRQNLNQNQQNNNSSMNGNITSSPIVQNRIKTNGSLPREKKSPFQQQDSPGPASHQQYSFNGDNSLCNRSTGYENVRLVGVNQVEINGCLVGSSSSKTVYENVSINKLTPQSPRTKIRTNCLSPKKDQSFSALFSSKINNQHAAANNQKLSQQEMEYENFITNFEENLQIEMQAIEESSKYQLPAAASSSSSSSSSSLSASSAYKQNSLTLKLTKSPNKNINNLKLNIKEPSSLQNSPKLNKKPAPAPRTLLKTGSTTGGSLPHLADEKSEKQLKIKEMKNDLERQLLSLQDKLHRMEAQRNATRVMEENQQAKLKQCIEMKQDQVKKLKNILKHNPKNECLREEMKSISQSLENDRKTFEDLEFQYLEEESEWQALHEDIRSQEINLSMKIRKTQLVEWKNQQTFEKVKNNSTNQLNCSSSAIGSSAATHTRQWPDKPYDIGEAIGIMSQSLFGSAEILCPKRTTTDDLMSRSVNENMFFNNKIELPSTSTPKRPQLQIVNIDDDELLQNDTDRNNADKEQDEETFKTRMRFNLSLGSDDFEVNPLENRVPSQDDIDRICKMTSDAPISSHGANTKIFDSIKEIERNRQLLLQQQGHHVIEHERQKMNDLKKKIHSEARAHYIAKLNGNNCNAINNSTESLNYTSAATPTNNVRGSSSNSTTRHSNTTTTAAATSAHEDKPLVVDDKENITGTATKATATAAAATVQIKYNKETTEQQRHSQPEATIHQYEQNRRHSSTSRPLSDSNSQHSCDDLLLTQPIENELQIYNNNNSNRSKSINALHDDKRSQSVNSTESTESGSVAQAKDGSNAGVGGERKRALPKHQRPLTRYLPIFSTDLDLKQHIESAGHQLNQCPHVFVDAYSCRGYLHKLGATFHGWSKRWFVLDRQRNALIYYSDKLERKPRGGAYFSTIDEVYLDHLNVSKSGRPHCTFIVKTKKRSYHLQAASDAAARIWIDAIITGAQGNLDY